ncbi:copper resistance CopC family protein [Planomicrobium sp. Y74]|uniref:copper resistance CopC family protein n=1 Tax=Planomicrobium sp. Y74 TaxID=2478977 RepID=UPI000EF4D25C|nr:copper resistance CopC family protein [Planomicrobium sp. Y74]RLQ90103.1 copper resistance protein CopC [Planomicrobium sp. Y74]
MKKLAAIALLLLFLPVTAHAHSGLSSSMPAEGATLEGSPEEIQFLFESPIQQGDMTIKDESGNTVEVSGVTSSEMELTGELAEELPNGAYTVEWSAISEDSHEVTGTLTFNIAAEETEEAAEEETTEEAAEESASEEATETTEQSEEAAAPATEPATAETPWITIIIIAIFAIAAVTFFVMARRK